MRYSKFFGRTLREDPAEAEIISHRFLQRGGFIKPLGSGIYTQMPLGWRVSKKIMNIFRHEMDALGCQEMAMPVLNPAEIWKKTGRWAVAVHDDRDVARQAREVDDAEEILLVGADGHDLEQVLEGHGAGGLVSFRAYPSTRGDTRPAPA